MVLSLPSARTPEPSARVMMVVRLFHPWVGGTERQAHKLARALLATGADVQVVTGRWFRGTPRLEVVDGVPVFRSSTLYEFLGVRGLRKFGGYLFILTLSWHLWRRRATYDVIHVHGLSYHSFAAALVGRRLGKPVVVKLANSGPASDITRMRDGQQLAGSRFLLRGALASDAFVAVNRQVVTELVAAGVERSRIVELPNGVTTGPARHTDHQPQDASPAVLFVGRLHPQKGLDTLLHAFALLTAADRLGGVRLRLVGDGPSQRDLVSLAEELEVAGRVEFAGAHDDVAPFLAGADLFVLPSHAEGLSNALLEAMSHGLAVVASDIPGNRDVITDGHDGILVPPGDPHALADQLGRLLRDPRLRAELGRAARETVVRAYSLEEVADEHLRLYRRLRGGRGEDRATADHEQPLETPRETRV